MNKTTDVIEKTISAPLRDSTAIIITTTKIGECGSKKSRCQPEEAPDPCDYCTVVPGSRIEEPRRVNYPIAP